MRYSLPLIFLLIIGCKAAKPTTQPSAYERSQNALKDPFNYSPNVGKPDISGGNLGELNNDAMNRDLDHVFNP